MKVIILVNSRSGANALRVRRCLATIQSAAEAAGLIAEVWRVAGKELPAAAAAAANSPVDAVVAAGGDGTISAVAAALAGGDKPLGIIPRGTKNHFARDLRLPFDPAAAARVVASGQTQRIDLGEVNGHTFVNNASIGIYPAFVLARDGRRAKWKRKHWLSMGIAALRAVRSLPLVDVRIRVGDDAVSQVTPVVVVGNNAYEFTLPNLGSRHRLDMGELSLHVARSTTRWGIVWLALRGLLGRLRPASDFHVSFATELLVASPRPSLFVALDGEVRRLPTPLEFRIRPRALSVLTGQAGEPSRLERA